MALKEGKMRNKQCQVLFKERITLIFNPSPADPGYALPRKSVDPDQLDSDSALFAIQYLNLYQQPGSSKMTG